MSADEVNRVVKLIKERIGEQTGCQHWFMQVEPIDSHVAKEETVWIGV